MPWPAKILTDAKVAARIADILARVRQEPDVPRIAFTEGLPKVYIVHEDVWNLLLSEHDQLQVLKQLLHEQGVLLEGPDVTNLPIQWDAVRDSLGEHVRNKENELPLGLEPPIVP